MEYCTNLACWQHIPCSAHHSEQVLLVGLSANPPTFQGGHVGLIEFFAHSNQFDQVWALPVYAHMFSAKKSLAPFNDRVAMLRLALRRTSKVKVSEVEKELCEQAMMQATHAGLPLSQVRVGTVDVLRHLQAVYPNVEFSLALGTDTFSDLSAGKWKNGEEILRRWRVVVVDRPGLPPVPDSALSAKGASPLIFEVVRAAVPGLAEVSSTLVRGSRDEHFLAQALHPDVLEYIKQHKLYAFEEPLNQPENTAS